MAQPSTAWKFSDFYNRVSQRAFNTSTPTGTNLVEVKRFVNEGYQIFLQSYFWLFLYPTASLDIVADDTATTLPEDFGAIHGMVSRSAASQRLGLEEVSPDEIRRRRAVNDVPSIPFLYALSPVEFVAADGQTWEMLVYPTSDSAITLAFQYRRAANLLDDAADFPLGGALHSMTILQAAYMVWEQEKHGDAQVEEKKFQQRLAASITIDNDLRPNIIQAGRDKHAHVNLTTIDLD